jgi:hypothetical protein
MLHSPLGQVGPIMRVMPSGNLPGTGGPQPGIDDLAARAGLAAGADGAAAGGGDALGVGAGGGGDGSARACGGGADGVTDGATSRAQLRLTIVPQPASGGATILRCIGLPPQRQIAT